MNKREKEVIQAQLDAEKAVLKQLEKQYQAALKDINQKVKLFEYDIKQLDDVLKLDGLDEASKVVLESQKRSKVYQKQYQEALQGQISGILDKLHGDTYGTIESYLKESYTDAFVGTAYDLAGQGIPVIMPIDQAAAVKAVMTDSKISEGLYNALGVDTRSLKKAISSEITRGIASGMLYNDIARNISNVTKAPLSRAKTITRTEGHRIQQASTMDAQKAAKAKGADVVKQWDASLDSKTRPTHRRLDGQIREVDEPFEVNGKKAMAPGYFGDPAEDCNCRCVSLTRARWALDEDELATLQERAEFFGLDKAKDFQDFKNKYLNVGLSSGKQGDSDGYTTIDEVVPFNFFDKKAIQSEIKQFEKSHADAKVEHAIVFSPDGNMYRLTGTKATVNTELVGADALFGCDCVHNHPIWEGFERADSFSLQDVVFAVKNKTGTNYLVSGDRKESFVYTGKLSESEIADEYKRALYKAMEIAFDNDLVLEYRQEAAMRILAESLEGFEYHEDI